jgi:hypothetical protein
MIEGVIITRRKHIVEVGLDEQYRDWLVAQQDDEALQVLESELGRKVRPDDIRSDD